MSLRNCVFHLHSMLSVFGMLTMLSTLSMVTSVVLSTPGLLTVLRAMHCMTEHDQWIKFYDEKIVLSVCDVQVFTQ